MKQFGDEILAAARSRVGQSFSHHYRPVDICSGGMQTNPYCLERGLSNDPGYDCSGLVIASVCDVLGVPTTQWPPNLRHTKQLLEISQPAERPNPGDTLLYKSYNKMDGSQVTHTGIFVSHDVVVHASGATGMVEESVPRFNMGDVTRHVIRAAVVARLLSY